MRREPSFRAQDTIIWATSLLLAAILGAVASYVAVGALGSANTTASMRDMLALTGAGFALIIIALHGRLVRAFLLSFAIVFFVGLMLATHGFANL